MFFNTKEESELIKAYIRENQEKLCDFEGTSAFVEKHPTVFWYVAHWKNWTLLKLLLKSGLQPDISPEDGAERGLTPLWYAVCYQQWDLVLLLLEKGANPNVSPQEGVNRGITPLWYAANLDRWEIVSLLLEKGARDLNAKDGELLSKHTSVTKTFKQKMIFAEYHEAMQQGLGETLYYIGGLHHKGVGLIKNQARAIQLFRLAAAQGHLVSIQYLQLFQDSIGGMIQEKKTIRPTSANKIVQAEAIVNIKEKKPVKQEVSKVEVISGKDEFLHVLNSKSSQLREMSAKLRKIASEKKELQLSIFSNIRDITQKLKKPLEGRLNKSRLADLIIIKDSWIESKNLSDEIKKCGKEVEQLFVPFLQLCNGLQGTLSAPEKLVLEKRLKLLTPEEGQVSSVDWGKFLEIRKVLIVGKVNFEQEAVLKSEVSTLEREWKLIADKFEVLERFIEKWKALDARLEVRVQKYEKSRPSKDNILTIDEDEITRVVEEITEAIRKQEEAELKTKQDIAQIRKKALATKKKPSVITIAQSVENEPVSPDSKKDISRSERRLPLKIAYIQGQVDKERDKEREKQQAIRYFHIQETVGNIANGLFTRPLPRDEEEVKEKVEHSDLLNDELGVLHSVINLLEVDNAWTSEMRYALLGSFARVNEVIGQECRDREIVKIAKRLRNVIFKHYETIQAKMYSDVQWLGIVKAWIHFYETPKVGVFVTEQGVLTEVNSPLLSSCYEDISFLKTEVDNVDFSKDRACLTDMQQYFERRNKEYDNVIAYAAHLFFLGVTGAKLKALRVFSKDKPEAVLVMRAFELLNIYASQIIAEGVDARHPRKAPVLYLHGLRARQEINVAYEYEDNDMQAILVSRINYLRNANTSEDTVLWSTHVLAAVDNIGFKQLETRLVEDKILNGELGARSVLIPCNLGNAHWVGIYLKFDTSGQVVQALYTDSLRQNSTIPLTLQKQLQAVYPTAVFERRALMIQEDSTSCGPYAIENLLLCVLNLPANTSDASTIRQLHLKALKKYRTDFYSAFYERQSTNTPTMASLEKQLGYIGKLKKVVFSKYELHRILCIKSCLSQLSKESETALIKAFGDQAVANYDHGVHLTMIRSVLEESVRATDLFEVLHLKALSELLLLLCGVENWQSGIVLPQNLDFKVGYEEILAVANISCTPEQVNSIQQSVMKQIKWDSQFVLQLQAEYATYCPKVFGKESIYSCKSIGY